MAARGALRMPRQALNRFNALGGRTICNGQKGYGEGMIARLGATVRFGEGSSSTVSVREGDVRRDRIRIGSMLQGSRRSSPTP